MPRGYKWATEEERHNAKLASQHKYVATHYTQVRGMIRSALKKRYDADPEAARARARKYTGDNRQKVQKQRRQNYQKNRKRELIRAQTYREKNPEKLQATHKASNRKKYLKNRQVILAAGQADRIANPEKYNKPRRDARAKDGDRIREQDRRRYQANPQPKLRAFAKRRARKKSLSDSFSQEEHIFMLHYWSYACAICGNQEGFQWTLALDHFIPLSAPHCPGTIATNMLPLCHGTGGCNNSKNGKDAHTWLVQRFGARKAARIEQAIATYFAIVAERFRMDEGLAAAD